MSAYPTGLQINNPSFATVDNEYAAANYIGTLALTNQLGLYEPDVDPEITRRYGREDVSGLLQMTGGLSFAAKDRIEYSHYEKDFAHGLIFATCAGSAANTEATFTLETNSKTDISYGISPFTSTNTFATIMPRKYDLLQLPGRQELIVSSVNKVAGTFTAYSVDGSVIPAVLADVQIVVKGTIQPEGSDKMETRNSRIFTYTNQMFSHRADVRTTGRAIGEKSWVTFKSHNGKSGKAWYFESLYNNYHVFKDECEMIMYDGKQISNTALVDAAGFETLSKTEGLITTISTAGTNVPHGGTMTLAALNAMNTSLEKFKGDKNNLNVGGYDFVALFNKLFRNGDGADWGTANSPSRVQFGSGTGMEANALNLDFKDIVYNGYHYYTKSFGAFSDPTTMGAANQGYSDMGLVLPMGNTVTYNENSVNSSTESVRSMVINYKMEDGVSRYHKEWITGSVGGVATSTEDAQYVSMLTEQGLEVFAANRFGMFEA